MKIRIGSTKYNLIITDKDIMVGSDVCNGAIQADDEEIFIDSRSKIGCKRKTLWHETVHGILDEMGMYKLSEDEGFVDSFGRLLYAFHEDNNLEKIYEKLN